MIKTCYHQLLVFLSLIFFRELNATRLHIGIAENHPISHCDSNTSLFGYELLGINKTNAIHGFDIELFKYISYRQNWNFSQIKFSCLSYEEMFAKIKQNSIDIGIGGIPLSFMRKEEGFQYSYPTYSSDIRIISRAQEESKLFSFLDPFDGVVWLLILITVIVTGLLTWMFEEHKIECKGKQWRSNLKEMMYQSFSGVFYTSEIRLQKNSARILFVILWFMMLIISGTYTANLTTSLQSHATKSEIISIRDGISKNKKIAALNAHKPFIDEQDKDNIIFYNQESKDSHALKMHLLNGDIHALLGEAPFLDEIQSKYPCQTTIQGQKIANFDYALLYSTNSMQYSNNINQIIFEFRESKEYHRLVQKFIQVAPVYDECLTTVKAIGLAQVLGLWIIFGAFGLTAFLVVILKNYLCNKNKIRSSGTLIDKALEDMDSDEKQRVLDSYLMITDYIHIPSSSIHLMVENDIKVSLEKLESQLKKNFNDQEEKIISLLEQNAKQLGFEDIDVGIVEHTNGVKRRSLKSPTRYLPNNDEIKENNEEEKIEAQFRESPYQDSNQCRSERSPYETEVEPLNNKQQESIRILKGFSLDRQQSEDRKFPDVSDFLMSSK